jgi:threonyl-tRNA synthetase
MSKVPYMLIIGEQEEKDGTVSVRRHGEGDIGTMLIEDFTKLVNNEIKKTHKAFEV